MRALEVLNTLCKREMCLALHAPQLSRSKVTHVLVGV